MNILNPSNANLKSIKRKTGTGAAGNPLDERLIPVVNPSGEKLWEGKSDAYLLNKMKTIWNPTEGSSKVKEITITIPNIKNYEPRPNDILSVCYPKSNKVAEDYIVADLVDVMSDAISVRGYVLTLKLKNTL